MISILQTYCRKEAWPKLRVSEIDGEMAA